MLPRAIPPAPVLLAFAVSAHAQSAADGRWIAQCRDHDDGWRVQHCEVRVVTPARAGTIAVDPGRNGAVSVEGWDRDSIEVHARFQTQAATQDQAVHITGKFTGV